MATFQVTSWLVPPVHATAVLGAVTAKGPELPSTVTVVEASFTPPRPSRAVRRNDMVRLIAGSASPMLLLDPSSMLLNVGKVRVGVTTGRYTRKMGRALLSASLLGITSLADRPRSISSQL